MEIIIKDKVKESENFLKNLYDIIDPLYASIEKQKLQGKRGLTTFLSIDDYLASIISMLRDKYTVDIFLQGGKVMCIITWKEGDSYA